MTDLIQTMLQRLFSSLHGNQFYFCTCQIHTCRNQIQIRYCGLNDCIVRIKILIHQNVIHRFI